MYVDIFSQAWIWYVYAYYIDLVSEVFWIKFMEIDNTTLQ